MKIMSFIMVAGCSRLSHHPIINLNTIYSTNKINKINNTNYVIAINLNKRKRIMQMIFNQYNNGPYYKCYFCNGRGYVPCTKCKNYLCIDIYKINFCNKYIKDLLNQNLVKKIDLIIYKAYGFS